MAPGNLRRMRLAQPHRMAKAQSVAALVTIAHSVQGKRCARQLELAVLDRFTRLAGGTVRRAHELLERPPQSIVWPLPSAPRRRELVKALQEQAEPRTRLARFRRIASAPTSGSARCRS